MIAIVLAVVLAAAPASQPSYAVVDRIAGPDGGWDLLSVDPTSRRLYLAHGDAVTMLDLASGKLTPALVPMQRGHDALAIPGTGELLATNGGSNTAVIADGATGKVRATIPTGEKPDAATYDPATRLLFVMNPGAGTITAIDPVRASVRATIAVGGSLELGVADGEGHLFVNVEDRNEVAVIDARGLRLERRFPLAGCDEPTGIAYSMQAKRLISACANGVAVVSNRDGTKVAALTIGPRPDGALYDARRGVALVPSGGDGTLAVIRLAGTPAVLATVPTAKGARTAALDPVTGRVYLPAADYLPAVGKERPKMVPGSFCLIVVTPR